MNYTLRHRTTEGIVAAAPVVAVLLAFSLLLTLLRQSRTQRAAAGSGRATSGRADRRRCRAALDLPAAPARPRRRPPRRPRTERPRARRKPRRGRRRRRPARPRSRRRRRNEPLCPPDGPRRRKPPTGSRARTPPRRPRRAWRASRTPEDEPTPRGTVCAADGAGAGARHRSRRQAGGRAGPRAAGIRYAGNGVPGTAGQAAGGTTRAAAHGPHDDTGTARAGQFAGLVYPAREDHPDAGATPAADDTDALSDRGLR